MWNRDKQCVPLRHKESSPRTFGGVDLRYRFVGVCVDLLDDIDFPGTADCINAAAFVIVEDLIRIAGDSNARNRLAGFRVKYDKLRWKAAANKQSVIRFIEAHRKIPKSTVGFPS